MSSYSTPAGLQPGLAWAPCLQLCPVRDPATLGEADFQVLGPEGADLIYVKG